MDLLYRRFLLRKTFMDFVFPNTQALALAPACSCPGLILPTCLIVSNIVGTLVVVHAIGLVQWCSTLQIVHIFDILCLLLSSLALR